MKTAGTGKRSDYFVLTTNVDHCFQKAGFDKKRLFYTQGDYGLWQCAGPCHSKTYDNESGCPADGHGAKGDADPGGSGSALPEMWRPA